MVVVSHLFSFSWINFRGRRDPHGTHLPLCRAIYFPTAPFWHFREFVKTVGYDEFVEITEYTGGIYNEIII